MLENKDLIPNYPQQLNWFSALGVSLVKQMTLVVDDKKYKWH